MDQLITAAVRQGFAVRQTERGAWVWVKDFQTLITKRTPRTPREWMYLVNALRGMGLEFPESS
ncbi:hypothetical protein [Salininema proteolyticum]|uniref:HicA toxin of toxin-antitoxin n=2 Tax=Salininema proteolyticum TaxID=1607685 RepID=A0ABV8TXM1_9ACTN